MESLPELPEFLRQEIHLNIERIAKGKGVSVFDNVFPHTSMLWTTGTSCFLRRPEH